LDNHTLVERPVQGGHAHARKMRANPQRKLQRAIGKKRRAAAGRNREPQLTRQTQKGATKIKGNFETECKTREKVMPQRKKEVY